jgi:hypothetical protein
MHHWPGVAALTVRRIARMQAQEIYRLLVRRIRRGIVVFGALFVGLCIASGLALADRHTAWAAAAFVAAVLAGLGFRHVRSRDISARKISANAKIVYWAHPTVIPANEQWTLRYTTVQSLSLHLRDGSQFDACLSPKEMESFIAWLRQSNPSIRFGAYDTATSFPTDEFVAFIQERFPSARIERSSNDLGTVWIEVRAGAGHAQIVTYADGTMGGTDIARSEILYEDISPFAPFGQALDSMQSAKDFMVRALSS